MDLTVEHAGLTDVISHARKHQSRSLGSVDTGILSFQLLKPLILPIIMP